MPYKNSWLLALMLSGAWSRTAAAGDPGAPNRSLAGDTLSMTIEQCLETGLENSKSLHASMMRLQAADAKAGEAGTALLPTVRFAGSYVRLSDVPSFQATVPAGAFGPNLPPQALSFPISQTILNNTTMRLSVQQPLFTGFRLTGNAAMAGRQADAAEKELERDKSTLVYSIKSAYWGLYKAIEFEKVIDENVAQVRAHLRDVQNMYEQGIVTTNEVLKVRVQLSSAEIVQVDARNNVQLAMIGLDNVIGLPLTTPVRITSAIGAADTSRGDLDSLIARAIERRPDLGAADLRIKAGEAGVRIARSGWYPQVALTGNYTCARPNPRILPARDEFDDTWDVGVSVSLDVWNWGSVLRQTDQAEALLAQARDAAGLLRDGVRLDVTQSYLSRGQAAERIRVAEEGVRQAEENYRVTDERFKSGIALNSDLLDAEAALLQARWSLIQALVDHELSSARLQQAIGN